MNEEIELKKQSGVATITINRPQKRNAINYDGWLELQYLAKVVDQDEDVRVVIVQGSGKEAFSSGADIADFDNYLQLTIPSYGSNAKDGDAELPVLQKLIRVP